jgi:hypothetical protein
MHQPSFGEFGHSSSKEERLCCRLQAGYPGRAGARCFCCKSLLLLARPRWRPNELRAAGGRKRSAPFSVDRLLLMLLMPSGSRPDRRD